MSRLLLLNATHTIDARRSCSCSARRSCSCSCSLSRLRQTSTIGSDHSFRLSQYHTSPLNTLKSKSSTHSPPHQPP